MAEHQPNDICHQTRGGAPTTTGQTCGASHYPATMMILFRPQGNRDFHHRNV
ncbi:MAG TPA: hypothetical protein VMX74_10490 [Pirellulales bacterium]|nr:hypothetical protein [Pirellulales bacterium]